MVYWNDESRNRARLGCTIAGVLFGFGWWVFIDALLISMYWQHPFPFPLKVTYFVPGLGTTLALVMINTMAWHRLNEDNQLELLTPDREEIKTTTISRRGCSWLPSVWLARMYVIFWMLVTVASLVWAILIFRDDCLPLHERSRRVKDTEERSTLPSFMVAESGDYLYPGEAIFAQCILVLVATFVMKLFTASNTPSE